MTPEERAEKELAEELGFEIKKLEEDFRHGGGYVLVYDGDEEPTDGEHWKLWSLALRQRVELNKLKPNA